MPVALKRVLLVHLAALVGGGLTAYAVGGAMAGAGFAAGSGLFAANLWLIAGLGNRLLGRARAGTSGARSVGLALLLFLKVFGLGVGAYLALVRLDLPAGYFVAGLAWALATLVAAASFGGSATVDLPEHGGALAGELAATPRSQLT